MGPIRVDYRERQRLSRADLRLEQDYRLGLIGRHAIAHHRAGVVRGLRLLATDAGFVLGPGVAVDGHGREIVLAQAVDIAPPVGVGAAWQVRLHYCETEVPAASGCADGETARVGPSTQVVAVDGDDLPDTVADDFLQARAAGLQGLSPQPVRVADVQAAKVVADAVAFTAVRAGRVRSPVDGSTLQVGADGSTDVFAFLVSTRAGGAAVARRLGIDRDGKTHVWGRLMVSARSGVATLKIADDLVLRYKATMPAGDARRVSLQGTRPPKAKRLSQVVMSIAAVVGLEAAHTTPLLPRVDAPITPPKSKPRSSTKALLLAAGLKGTLDLVDAQGRPIAITATVDRLVGDSLPRFFSLPLTPLDARLSLGKPGVAADPSTSTLLSLRPAPPTEPDPLARELRAVTTSAPTDPIPATELRITGGAIDDTDTRARIAIGAHDKNAIWRAGLSLDGGRRLTFGDRTSESDLPSLVCDKSVYLPSIGPKDLLVPDLTLLAWLNGLWRAGHVTPAVTLKLTNAAPGPMLRHQFAYTLQVTKAGTVEARRTFELVCTDSGRGDLSFRAIDVPIPLASGTLPQTVTDTRLESPGVHLVVAMLVDVAGKPRLALSNALTFAS